ncbi:hypothetical protein JOD20_000867 [Herpetosiphon giganteus]|nr:hypothetical protein [Herpetosiphon giganteus]
MLGIRNHEEHEVREEHEAIGSRRLASGNHWGWQQMVGTARDSDPQPLALTRVGFERLVGGGAFPHPNPLSHENAGEGEHQCLLQIMQQPRH